MDPVKQGIPQGSVLRPLLFILDMPPFRLTICKYGLNFHSYAADTQMYISQLPPHSLSNCFCEPARLHPTSWSPTAERQSSWLWQSWKLLQKVGPGSFFTSGLANCKEVQAGFLQHTLRKTIEDRASVSRLQNFGTHSLLTFKVLNLLEQWFSNFFSVTYILWNSQVTSTSTKHFWWK